MTATVRDEPCLSHIAPLIAIAGFSGFAGLGYEIVWTRLLANVFGHEIVAVLGVLAALFGGLAAGSLLLGRRVGTSTRPDLLYAGLELAIGAWAFALVPLLPAISALTPILTPIDASPLRLWTVAFGVPFIILLPATLAMGATLPALESVLAPRIAQGSAVGWAYATNTFGAVCGTLVTTFWIMPALGLSRTLMSLAVVNLACAAAMAIWGSGPESGRSCISQSPTNAPSRLPSLFVTGLLGIGYEVVAVRTLSQVLENTVYTFAALLSVYLLGTAIGAGLYGRFAQNASRKNAVAVWLPAATCIACVSGILALGNVDALQTVLGGLPRGLPGAIAGELTIAAFVFLIPTVGMGALFTHLAQGSRDSDGTLGPALAANTAGAALAPMLFGPMLFPLLGAKLLLALIAAGYGLVAPKLDRAQLWPRAGAVGIALSLLLTSLSLRFVQIPPGGALLWHRDGMMASVSVVEDRAHDRYLAINNHFRLGGTASIRSDYHEADIPLLLHPRPENALFLGLGTGTTISATRDYPGLSVDGVELVPEVPDTFALFEKSAPDLRHNANIHIHVGDARRYVQAASTRYDVVIADVYHPWIDGAGTLYTQEHFAAVRKLLTDDGLFCQWLPLHQLDLPTLRVIVRTFLSEFPNASAYIAQFSIATPLIALVGTTKARPYPAGWFNEHVADQKLRARLASVDLNNELALFGLLVAGSADLAEFAGKGPLNSDDRQIVTFNAPRAAYMMAESPGQRLLSLLGALHPKPESLIEGDAAAATRLADYWQARNRFLELGVRTAESTAIRDVISEVAPKLIEVVRLSADFDAAYRPVLAMAEQLARTDAPAARRLLEDLNRANPARPEARRQLVGLPAD